MSFSDFIDRAKKAANLETDKDFASLLGLSREDFANRKRRKTLKPLILSWAEKTDIDLNWLFKGKEPSQVTFNREMMVEIITEIDGTIEEMREDHDFAVDPKRKAEAIVLLYEEFMEKGDIKKEKVNNIIKLIC